MTDPISCPTSASFDFGSMNGHEVMLGLVLVGLAVILAIIAVFRFALAQREFRQRIKENEKLGRDEGGKKEPQMHVPIGTIVWAAFDRRDAKRDYAEARSQLYLECAAVMVIAGLGVWLSIQAYQLPPSYLECQHTLQALTFRSISRILILSSIGGFVAYLIQLHKDAQREVQVHTQLRVTADAQRLIHMAIRPEGEYPINADGTLTEQASIFVATVMDLTRTNMSVYAPPENRTKDDSKAETKDKWEPYVTAQELLETVSKAVLEISKMGLEIGDLKSKLAKNTGSLEDESSSKK